MGPTPLDKLTGQLARFRESCPGLGLDSEQFAELMDEEDELRQFRARFEFPLLGSLPIGRVSPVSGQVVRYSEAVLRRGGSRRPGLALRLHVRQQPRPEAQEGGCVHAGAARHVGQPGR